MLVVTAASRRVLMSASRAAVRKAFALLGLFETVEALAAEGSPLVRIALNDTATFVRSHSDTALWGAAVFPATPDLDTALDRFFALAMAVESDDAAAIGRALAAAGEAI